MRHLSLVLALGLLAGCQTYDSPFVHKSEAELDAMEYQNALAAESFQNQDYAQAEAILNQLATEQTVSQPLYQLERVPVLLMQGKREEAHDLMMKTREQIETLFDPQSEARAVSLWHGENNKVYKGEPHERATLYALLALSFMEKGEWEDAIRCVKNGLLADSSTEGERYNSDYGLLHYIGYIAARHLGDTEGANEYKRELMTVLKQFRSSLLGDAAAHIEDPNSFYAQLFDETQLPNAFVLVWTGRGPYYGRGGEYEETRYVMRNSIYHSMVSLELEGQSERRTMPAFLGSVGFQATTRGGRAMDNVLADKAALKKTMEISKNVFFVVGTACISAAQGDAALPMLCIGGGCYVAGIVPWIIGECINSQADIRYWHNLPEEFMICPLVLPQTEQTAVVRAFREWDGFAAQKVPLKPTGGFSVYHVGLSEEDYLPESNVYLPRTSVVQQINRRMLNTVNTFSAHKDFWMTAEIPVVEEAK